MTFADNSMQSSLRSVAHIIQNQIIDDPTVTEGMWKNLFEILSFPDVLLYIKNDIYAMNAARSYFKDYKIQIVAQRSEMEIDRENKKLIFPATDFEFPQQFSDIIEKLSFINVENVDILESIQLKNCRFIEISTSKSLQISGRTFTAIKKNMPNLEGLYLAVSRQLTLNTKDFRVFLLDCKNLTEVKINIPEKFQNEMKIATNQTTWFVTQEDGMLTFQKI